MPRDFYDVLGVDRDADPEELRDAYRDRAREYHPDLNDGERATRMFALVNRANDVLSDAAERAAYDRLGHDEYVEKRMNGLPSMSFDDEDEADDDHGDANAGDGSRTDEPDGVGGTAAGGDAARSGRNHTGSTSTASSNSGTGSGTVGGASTSDDGARSGAGSSASTASAASSTATTAGGSSGSDAGTGSRSGGGSSRATAGTSASATGSGSSTPGAEATGAATGSVGGTPGAGASATGTGWQTGAGEATTTTDAASARRRGLRRAYAALLVIAATYAVGLATYAGRVAPALVEAARGFSAAPTTTLTAGSPLPSALAVVREAATTVAAGSVGVEAATTLAFPVGAAALPGVLLGTVARYGRGTAWAYALPSLGPVVAVAAVAASVTPATTWLHLVGLVVAPAVATTAFLVDVGRYLLATR